MPQTSGAKAEAKARSRVTSWYNMRLPLHQGNKGVDEENGKDHLRSPRHRPRGTRGTADRQETAARNGARRRGDGRHAAVGRAEKPDSHG